MLKKIAITMGDPSGIGAEVIVKSMVSRQILDEFIPIVIGDPAVLSLNCERYGYNLNFIEVTEDELDSLKPLECHECYVMRTGQEVDMSCFRFGVIDAEYGSAAASYIKKAARLAMERKVDAIVTAPINKKAFNLAGYDFQGHTDFLAHLTGNKKEVMMLSGGKMSVILCTVHVALKDAISMLTEDLIVETVSVAKTFFRKYLKKISPKFAVAALNPHASEGGTFGTEEQEIIMPAIRSLRAKGVDITDPLPSDSLFYKAKEGAYDAVICMYHDQGMIPIKLLYFGAGTNITLGLDIIRTSVDHGTAFEIAGTGEAGELSMINALERAIEMSKNEQ